VVRSHLVDLAVVLAHLCTSLTLGIVPKDVAKEHVRHAAGLVLAGGCTRLRALLASDGLRHVVLSAVVVLIV
jgi:hypothetical protein